MRECFKYVFGALGQHFGRLVLLFVCALASAAVVLVGAGLIFPTFGAGLQAALASGPFMFLHAAMWIALLVFSICYVPAATEWYRTILRPDGITELRYFGIKSNELRFAGRALLLGLLAVVLGSLIGILIAIPFGFIAAAAGAQSGQLPPAADLFLSIVVGAVLAFLICVILLHALVRLPETAAGNWRNRIDLTDALKGEGTSAGVCMALVAIVQTVAIAVIEYGAVQSGLIENLGSAITTVFFLKILVGTVVGYVQVTIVAYYYRLAWMRTQGLVPMPAASGSGDPATLPEEGDRGQTPQPG